MQKVQTTTLNRATLMFPLALVLFEFSVYIGNDLVQPAMLAITKDFGVSSSWAPSSMSFYLLGGACVAWLLGPLSDRLGRRKVLLTGVLFFVVTCLLILLTKNIQSFLALRFLQGIGLTVISAVGYAAIQETFEERDAIKVMALMANISLLAPLLGPVVGAFLIDHVSWHWGFIGIAFLAFLSWFGLNAKMPNTKLSIPKQPLRYIFDDFKQVYKNKRFLALSAYKSWHTGTEMRGCSVDAVYKFASNKNYELLDQKGGNQCSLEVQEILASGERVELKPLKYLRNVNEWAGCEAQLEGL